MVARKRGRKSGETSGRNSGGGSSSTTTTTDTMINSLPTANKFILGCSLYRYLQEYWRLKGKPFLQRTLSYQRNAIGRTMRHGKRKRGNSPMIISSSATDGYNNNHNHHHNNHRSKRLKLTTTSVSGGSSGSSRSGGGECHQSNADWKPFATKVVFESVYDKSGAVGLVDVDVLVVKTVGDQKLLVADHNHSLTTVLGVPRNYCAPGTNGHQQQQHQSAPPSISILLDGGPQSKLALRNNGATTAAFSSTWLLCRCKLPLPKASRKGLRNSAQRRSNAAAAAGGASPLLATDCCYGYFDVSRDTSVVGDGNSEVTLFLKRLDPTRHNRSATGLKSDHNQSGSDAGSGTTPTPMNGGTNGAGNVFSRELFLELLADMDSEPSDTSNMPTMKLRLSQTCVQRRMLSHQVVPSSVNLSPRSRRTLIEKRDRLACIVENLPMMALAASSYSEDDDDDDDEELNPNHHHQITYQICLEGQQAPQLQLQQQRNGGPNSSSIIAETCLSRLSAGLSDPRRCPFCQTRCADVYALMQHHRCCHARFNCLVKENGSGIILDLRPSQNYDGRLEIRLQKRRVNRRKIVPVKRTRNYYNNQAKVIFHRPVNSVLKNASGGSAAEQNFTSRKLDEFKTCPKEVEPDSGGGCSSEFVFHHARQYYHTQTCQKFLPEELDRDSEDEMDPEWLRDRMQRLIDEFTDVNEGEKSIMKMWNLHVLKHNYFGDLQMATACDTFLTRHGKRVIEQDLTNNFLLHLAELYNVGLLSQAQVYKLTKRLYAIKS